MRTSNVVVLLTLVAVVSAQIPSLGWCPDYQPMANFNMNRFLGQWHEAERYFTVTELGSRCVTTNYEKMADGRVWVSNEIKNSFTGVKRVIEGQLQVVGRDGEGKLSVKYTSLPVPYDTQYTVLDTDYDNFAVMWSCSGIGPVHTQNAWVLTRERLAPGLVLQRAYGVLDKFKISRAFFVKTNQEDCTIQPLPIEAVDPTPAPEQGKNAVDEQTSEKKDEGKDSGVKTVPELIKSTAESQKVSDADAKKPEEEKKEDPPKVAAESEKPKEEKPVADEPAKTEVPKKTEAAPESANKEKVDKKDKIVEIEKKKIKITLPLPPVPSL